MIKFAIYALTDAHYPSTACQGAAKTYTSYLVDTINSIKGYIL